MKEIQNVLLQYIEEQGNLELNFTAFTKLVVEKKILDNLHEFRSFLHLLSKISNNHYRDPDFLEKIENIIQHYKNQIQKYFTGFDIYHIFKNNKRILLLLIEQKLVLVDNQIASEILKLDKFKYSQYFYPEIRPFLNQAQIDEINFNEISEDFDVKRKNGQSDSYLAKLIQEDNIKDFIIYVNKNSIQLSSQIKLSIFETNSFLLKQKKVTLIEYAAFFGSIQIFQYLKFGNVELNQSLWLYAIHSKNGELINLLEENHVEIEKNSVLFESIKCHHIDIANYIQDNICNCENYTIQGLKYYNFHFIQIDKIGQLSFCSLCKYDYYIIVDILLNNNMVDVNKKECYKNEGQRYIEKDKKAALCCAVLKGNFEIIQRLFLCENLNINITNEYMYNNGYSGKTHINTSLHLAVEKEYIDIVKLLLTHKNINVNLRNTDDDDNKTALYIALEKENTEIIKILLSFKATDPNIFFTNIDYGDDGGTFIKAKSVLYAAVEKENIEIIKILLEYPNLDVNLPYRYILGDLHMFKREEITPLELAIEKENIEIIHLLLTCKNIDVNHNFEGTSLHKAVEKQNHEIIHLLLSCKKIDVNAIKEMPEKDGKTALHIAIEMKNIEIVKNLLSSKNIDINLPTLKRNWKYPEREIDLGPYYDDKAYENNEYYLKMLERREQKYQKKLEQFHERASSSKEFYEKETPLQLAIESNVIEIVQLLLIQKGINKDKIYFWKKIPENIIKLFNLYKEIENLK